MLLAKKIVLGLLCGVALAFVVDVLIGRLGTKNGDLQAIPWGHGAP